MMYRYGDATPFPFEENFIDTLSAATDVCVALFQADMLAAKGRAKARAIQQSSEQELQRLSVLERTLESALRPLVPEGKPTTPAEITAARIVGGARGAIKQSRASVIKRRETACRLALDDQIGVLAFEAIERFLIGHPLPRTQWTIRWRLDERGRGSAVAEALAPCELAATFAVAIPTSHGWGAPVRVSSIQPDLTLELQEERGWPKKRRRRCKRALHKLYITEIELSPARDVLTLRRSTKKPSPGYRVILRDPEHGMPTIIAVRSDGRPDGQPLALTGDSAVSLSRLWSQIDRAMHELLSYRSAMDSARFDGQPVQRMAAPARLAEAILGCIAPTVREMRRRSRVPGELVVKRDLGDGRREELFVPRAELEARFADLPLEYRSCFEAVGLSGEATCEFLSREFPLSPAAGLPAANLRDVPDTPVPPAAALRADTDAQTLTSGVVIVAG